MNDKKIVIATLAFVAGAGFGFAVGYSMNRKESEARTQEAIEAFKRYSQETEVENPENSQGEETEKQPCELFKDVKPAKFAKPDGTPGINYSKYNKDIQEKVETESPSDDDPDDEPEKDISPDDPEYEETYEEKLERESDEYIEHADQYRKEHEGKIELMTSDEWDTDFPETDYDRADIYYFTESDILTDEDGHQLNEEEYIGPKPRQVGWMRQANDDVIYIRNHPKETEYRLFKEHCSVEDWF